MPLTANLSLSVNTTLTRTLDLGQGSTQQKLANDLTFSDGVIAGQADRVFSDRRTLAASATEDLDVVGGALQDAYGATFTLARLKVLAVKALSTNTNNVRVTRSAANGVPWALAAGDGVDIAPGEMKILVARSDLTAIVCTAGTGDLITIANSGAGTAVDYEIIIIGASA